MKFKLPIALLALATAALQAEGAEKYYRFGQGQFAKSGKTKYLNTTDIGMYYTTTGQPPDSAAPQTIVFGGPERIDTAYDYPFDGGGTVAFKVGEPSNLPSFAVTENPIQVDRTMVVREGTLLLDGAHIQNHTKLNNAVSNLMVGGQGAHLVLDNGASYTQKIGYASNSTSALAIGSGDGKGKVTLSNGSLLHTDHFIFAGYRTISNGYVSWTERDGSGDAQGVRYANADTPGYSDHDEIYINSGSTMSAGTSLQFSNVTINIDGEGSCLRDNTLEKSPASPADVDPCSYLAYGSADNVETIINVTRGAQLDCNWNVSTGNSKGSLTQITVDGTNEGGTVKSTFSVAGTADFGGAEGWWSMNNAPKDGSSNTEVIVKNGAEAQFNQVKVGSNRQASISIDSNSTIVAHEGATNALITVYELGRIENSGIIELDITVNGGTYIGDGDADQFGGSVFTMLDGAVVEGLTMTTGTVNISGEVSLSNVTFGTVINAAGLMMLGGDDAALTVYIQQGSVINADDLNLGNGTNVAVVLDEGVIYEEGMELFTLTGSDSTQISELEAALGNNLAVYEYGNTEGEGTVVENATGSITTNVVPEPATATLSLLALAGLCARRRRK